MRDLLSCASKRRLYTRPMINSLKNITVVLFTLLSLTLSAEASVSSVTAVPSKVTVLPTGGGVSVTWRVVHTISAPATTVTSSPSYDIIINGLTVLTVSKSLSRTTTPTVGVPETLTFSEVIPVSVTLAKQIAKGGNNARIQRIFNDGLGAGTGFAQLIAGGGASGALNINRIELSFENGGKTNVVGQNSDLRAVAEINFVSRGLLQAEWRVIDSPSIRGGQFERRLSQVRRQLSSSGNGRVRLVSPKLPTGTTGLHEVKLVLIDPQTQFTQPVLRYYVNPNSTPGLSRLSPLEAFRPVEGVPFNSNTVFDWHPVAGAAAYQIELFDLPGGKNPLNNLNAAPLIVSPFDTDAELVVGKIVPGTQTSSTFAGFAEKHLLHGSTYLWRIRAISSGGTVLAQSDFRKILYP